MLVETSFAMVDEKAPYLRCSLSGFDASLIIIPFASRSSCAAFNHHPAFAPSGNISSGKSGSSFALASATDSPGANVGKTDSNASRIASYFARSTFPRHLGDVKFSISILSAVVDIKLSIDKCNLWCAKPHGDPSRQEFDEKTD